jgi:hypothetical protein
VQHAFDISLKIYWTKVKFNIRSYVAKIVESRPCISSGVSHDLSMRPCHDILSLIKGYIHVTKEATT